MPPVTVFGFSLAAGDGVELIDEQDGGCGLERLLEARLTQQKLADKADDEELVFLVPGAEPSA